MPKSYTTYLSAVPVHTSALAPRGVYLRVTAALEDAMARRKEAYQKPFSVDTR